jgi:beta-glucosidase/6-phospho-beta-glucosidase/beta-galactosidase
MGLFGNVDIADIPDDPFFVPQDTYLCVLSEASIITTNSGGQGFSIRWTIDEEDSDYNAMNIGDWFNIYPDVDAEDLTQQQKRTLSNLKKRLIDLGITPEDMDSIDENLSDLVGITAYVTVKNSVDKNDPDKKYTNVTKVSKVDED